MDTLQPRSGIPTRIRHGSLVRRRHVHGTRSRSTSQGQAIVEFALIFPLFLTFLLGLIEFAFIFNGTLAVQFAAQNSALIAAEIGDTPGSAGNLSVADCAILQEVERDLTPPAQR